MIINYHRPQTLEEAKKLLSQPDTRPIAGGTFLTKHVSESFSVVDLQALGLNKLHKVGNNLEIGATVTLQTLLKSDYTPDALRTTIELEAPLNLRTMGTVAGTLVTCDGRSPFGTIMLALNSKITFLNDNSSNSFGNYLSLRPSSSDNQPGKLITSIQIPLNVSLAFEMVARTPGDKPIVCAALARWSSGRARLTLGGWGNVPTLALDGNEIGGLKESARAAFTEAGDDWATSDYRMEMAGLLAERCLEKISSTD